LQQRLGAVTPFVQRLAQLACRRGLDLPHAFDRHLQAQRQLTLRRTVPFELRKALDHGYNGIADRGARFLFANTAITSLSLCGNRNGDGCAIAPGTARSLTHLELRGKPLGPARRAASEAQRHRLADLQL
jgi:hypothetical protein